MIEEKKSYFYVLSEDKECSELEKILLDSFKKFQKTHTDDSEVKFLHPDDKRFGEARRLFGITQLPAFVIADEPHKLETGTNPWISFNRPAIEQFQDEKTNAKIFNLITDMHYLLIDENILQLKQALAKTWLLKVFKSMWTELKDLVSISI